MFIEVFIDLLSAMLVSKLGTSQAIFVIFVNLYLMLLTLCLVCYLIDKPYEALGVNNHITFHPRTFPLPSALHHS